MANLKNVPIPKTGDFKEINKWRDAVTSRLNARSYRVDNSNGNPNHSDTALVIDSVVTELSWESVGPTGSGADNIWTAMDDIPANVDWIEVKVCTFCTSSGDTASTNRRVYVYARKNGSVQGAGTDNQVASCSQRTDAAGNAYASTVCPAKIPVDPDLTFDCYWDSTFTANVVEMYLIGYGYN